MATEQEKISFYVPRDEAARIRQVCEQDSRKISDYMRLLIRRDLAFREPLEATDGAAA